jgi:hypothetical protein
VEVIIVVDVPITVPRSRKCGSIHPLPHTPLWDRQLYLFVPITVTGLSKGVFFFCSSNIGFVTLNPTRGMVVGFLSVCCVVLSIEALRQTEPHSQES